MIIFRGQFSSIINPATNGSTNSPVRHICRLLSNFPDKHNMYIHVHKTCHYYSFIHNKGLKKIKEGISKNASNSNSKKPVNICFKI